MIEIAGWKMVAASGRSCVRSRSPAAVRRVMIPKPNGGERRSGFDHSGRVVQTALNW